MHDFTPARDQDAWATIRGFRYQVDMTLMRWLSIGPDQQLELECGEDIDLQARAMTEEGDTEFFRKLEQVKARARPVTLRNSSVIEAVANSYFQQAANPGLDLRFCYTTNATIGRERPNPFPSKASGIDLWQRYRSGTLDPPASAAVLQGFRDFFPAANRPKTISSTEWRVFVWFVEHSGDEAFIEFVEKFEFLCGQVGPDDLPVEVRKKIRDVAGFSDELQLEEVYNRLVLYALKLLTQPGAKRLSAELLTEQLAMPTLSATDHRLLQVVRGRLAAIELRVTQVEEAVSSLSDRVGALSDEVGEKFAAIELAAGVSVSPPPMVKRISLRTITIGKLTAQIRTAVWLALFGGSDTGKTHLAGLLTGANAIVWAKFTYEMAAAQAATVLHESLRSLSSAAIGRPSEATYCLLCEKMGSNSYVVLDDLPQFVGTDLLTERLAWLASACAKVGAKIVSTSHYQLPARLITLLPPNTVLEEPVPLFIEEEIKDVLSAYGAPAPVLASHIPPLVRGLTYGHPLLVVLAAQYLIKKEWRLSGDELSGMLKGDHATGITDEVLVRISKTLDFNQRELLYRLALSSTAVKDEVALQLAEVEPPIAEPKERLASLIGAWVQRPKQREVVVSPVARSVVAGNLSQATLRKCHLTLGQAITSRIMDPWEAQIAVGHFVLADEFNSAGALLISFLYQAARRPVVPEIMGCLYSWAGTSLPVQMKLGIRLTIRALQFWAFPRYGCSDAFALSELDSLMNQATTVEAPIALQVAALACLFLSERDFPRAIQYYSRALTLLRAAEVEPHDVVLPRRKKPAELLWNTITNIRSKADLELWKSAIAQLTPDEQKQVITSKDAHLGCIVLPSRMILVEGDKPIGDRDWESVTTTLQDLQDWADSQKWEHLHACALESEITLHGDYLNDLTPCDDKVERFLAREDRSEVSKGMICGIYGRMFASANKNAEALPWLERAISSPPSTFSHGGMMTLIAGVKCSPDLVRRREWSERAADLARTSRSVSHGEMTKVLGEQAIAQLAGEETKDAALRVYPIWSEAAEHVLLRRENNDDWKSLVVLFGHAQNYLATLARGDAPPQFASDGGAYARPFQGVFFTTHPERAELFKQESVAGLMWSQSRYARSAGDDASAVDWLQRTKAEIEALPESYLTVFITQDFIPAFLNDDDFALATDRARRGIEVSVAFAEAHERQGSEQAIPFDTPVDDLVNELSEAGRKQVEQFTVPQVYFPALLRIARLAVTNRPAALDAARQMAAICKSQAATAYAPENHIGASQVFQAVSDEANPRELMKLAHTFDLKEKQSLRNLGYLALSVADSLEDAFRCQLASIQVTWQTHPPETAIHRELWLPFLQDFWLSAIKRQRFAFRAPAVVEPDLATAQAVIPGARILAILRALQPAFRVKGLEESVRWVAAEYAKLTEATMSG